MRRNPLNPFLALGALAMSCAAAQPSGGGVVDAVAMAASAPDRCIAPLTYIALDAALVGQDDHGMAALGTYERVSPDGRFVLRSFSGALLGKVSLIELPAQGGQAIRTYRTPFSNEAFPVQNTWRYLVDVNGEHYRFKDVLTRQAAAHALFRAGMTGFYAAAAEMQAVPSAADDPKTDPPQRQQQRVFIRSLSWPQNVDPDLQGIGPLQIEDIEVLDDGAAAQPVRKTGSQFICQQRKVTDGGVYALPMIAVDGSAFSAIPQVPRQGQPSMRVYSLAAQPMARQQPCELRADLGFAPGKAVFGYASAAGQSAWLTYSDFGTVYVFDPQLRQTWPMDNQRHGVLASAFPALTRDGRVIYGATWRNCADARRCPAVAGYVVADPYQSTAYRTYWKTRNQTPAKTCITQADVLKERDAFARFHGLDTP
ncbi:MAG: hypothetical protein LBP52_08325 [Burkholderiaceae bacterium]|jgi:hypothetical protein|nr:hypothetical protein [Burkholderiaceae bacterium]